MRNRDFTRRQAVGSAGALIAGVAGLRASLGTPGSRYGSTIRPDVDGGDFARPATTTASPIAWNFVSRPDLKPPVVSFTTRTDPADRNELIFMAPRGYPLPQGAGRQSGAMIMDHTGEIVWYFPPAGVLADNLSVHSYQGEPVLAHLEGVPQLSGTTLWLQGKYLLRDSTYKVIATVAAVGKGWNADEHEFVITPEGTALLVANKMIMADQTTIGGPSKAPMLNSAIQEIDIATGKLLFHWDAMSHIPLAETQVPYMKGSASDPYHLNSVDIAPDGNLIISSRHTWTIYKVDRKTGEIHWRLGGKQNQFWRGPGVKFAWQHDVKVFGKNSLTIFDNEDYGVFGGGGTHVRPESRAIILNVEPGAKRASLAQAFTHPKKVLVGDQGSIQPLGNGRVFVGWGVTPYLSEYTMDGKLLMDGHLPIPGGVIGEVVQSYRTLKFPWSGRPAGPPAVAAEPGSNNGTLVYASWNGTTDVAKWQVLAGRAPSSLSEAGTATRSGFETKMPVQASGPYFAAVALDSNGKELGRSRAVKVKSTGAVPA